MISADVLAALAIGLSLILCGLSLRLWLNAERGFDSTPPVRLRTKSLLLKILYWLSLAGASYAVYTNESKLAAAIAILGVCALTYDLIGLRDDLRRAGGE